MSFGITRIHGTVETGASLNVTGSKSSFFGGYQPKWFDIADDLRDESVGGDLETAIRKVEAVATVLFVGVPSSTHTMIAVDGASFAGRGDNTGYGGAGTDAATTLSNLLGVTVTEKVVSGNAFA